MPDIASFDITTGCNLQEVDNAVNQANKEITQRYDFKGVVFSLELKRADKQLDIQASDEFKLEAIWDVLQTKLIKRSVPIKNLKRGNIERATGNSVRQIITLQQGIDKDIAKNLVKLIKEAKLKKVQAAIIGEQVRVSGPSRDDLQATIAHLKTHDFGIELQFGNFR